MLTSDLTCQLSLFDVFRDTCDMYNTILTMLSSTEKELLAHCTESSEKILRTGSNSHAINSQISEPKFSAGA
jgi:hypothetical protein